jgi:hypothetical protein
MGGVAGYQTLEEIIAEYPIGHFVRDMAKEILAIREEMKKPWYRRNVRRYLPEEINRKNAKRDKRGRR